MAVRKNDMTKDLLEYGLTWSDLVKIQGKGFLQPPFFLRTDKKIEFLRS